MTIEYDRVRKQIAKKYSGGSQKIGVILADRILTSDGIEIRADDQSLPRAIGHDVILVNEVQAYKQAQQDMLTPKDGYVWIKCLTGEEE